MPNNSQKRRAEMSRKAYGTVMDMGRILRCSRIACGLNVEYIAQCMDVSVDEWLEYESNRKPISGHVLIKLLIFGMEFWARNKKSFDCAATDTLHTDATTTEPNQKSDIINQK